MSSGRPTPAVNASRNDAPIASVRRGRRTICSPEGLSTTKLVDHVMSLKTTDSPDRCTHTLTKW